MKKLHSPPRSHAGSDGVAASPSKRPKPESGNSLQIRNRVLVVEDSLVVRDRLGALIRDAQIPCQTDFAATGAVARTQFDRLQPDVVVLDIALPDESGLDLLRDFKAQRPATVVIVLTTYAFPEFRDRAKTYGSDYFFNKSAEFEKVCEVLRDRLTQSPLSAEERGGAG